MNRPTLTACLLLLAWGGLACTATPQADVVTPVSSPVSTTVAKNPKGLTLSAIPDQEPEKLNTRYTKLAKYLEAELKLPVTYQPVADSAAAVAAFRAGEVDLVWFGGLTGVQARTPVTGAEALVQRRTDTGLTSVFIANKASKIQPFSEQAGLKALKNRTLTFGHEESTRDRLLPQYFLSQAGIKLSDFKNSVGFAKDPDTTLAEVQAGTYEVGVMSAQDWDSRVQQGKVDLNKVVLLWQTPTYNDYHWVIHPNVGDRFGKDFITKVENALLDLSPNVPSEKEILTLFGTDGFIRTSDKKYEEIKKIAQDLGKL